MLGNSNGDYPMWRKKISFSTRKKSCSLNVDKKIYDFYYYENIVISPKPFTGKDFILNL